MNYCKNCIYFKNYKLIYSINNNCIITIHNGIGSCNFSKDCYIYPEEQDVCNNFEEKIYEDNYY